MKQIIVVSDSHGDDGVLKEVLKHYPNANAYLHLGDSEDLPENLFPFISVKGNNDYFIQDESKIVEIEDIRIYMCHGHKMYLSIENMLLKAKSKKVDIFLYGHTHVPFYQKIENIIILNPGSLSYPRGVFAIIYIDNHQIDVQIQQLDK